MTPAQNDTDGIVIDQIGGNCPVQANGEIDGVPFYFRARGEHWSIEIGLGNTHRIVDAMQYGRDTEEAAALRKLAVWEHSEPYGGSRYAAGWMTEDDARAFIAKGANEWRAFQKSNSAPPRAGGA